MLLSPCLDGDIHVSHLKTMNVMERTTTLLAIVEAASVSAAQAEINILMTISEHNAQLRHGPGGLDIDRPRGTSGRGRRPY